MEHSYFRKFLAGCLLVINPVAAIDYEKDIKPILTENCLDCHGPDKAKSEFRVDQRAVMLRGGDSGLPSIVPGDPEKSYLLEVVKGIDPDMVMPPKGAPLSKDEISLLEEWIKSGAQWPGQMDARFELTSDHWSFQPVTRPEIPGTEDNPVDSFLTAKLSEKGLKANPAADPRSLIRRASIILTGLPPTPERAARFATDYAADPTRSYEALVDELLESPHFGERWAQHWLDVIRWAETNGSEANLYRKNAWVYRDYVIRAFNEDLPYDQFIREQIAGDSYGSGEATGFLVAGPHVPAATVGREPSAIRQARADRMDEVMQTVGASMMGLTMGCARCHNHKFDPISIQDYYSMTAVFQDVEFGSRQPELSPEHPRRLAARELWKKTVEPRNTLKNSGFWEENWGGYLETHFDPVTAKSIKITFLKGNVGLDELEIFGPIGEHINFAAARRGATAESAPNMDLTEGNPAKNAIDGRYGTMAWRAKTKDPKIKPWIEVTFDKPQSVGRIRLSSNREYYFDTDYLTKEGGVFVGEYRVEIRNPEGELKEIGATNQFKGKLKKNPELAAAHRKMNQLAAAINEDGPRPSFVGTFIEPVVTKVLHRGSPENPRDEVPPAAPAILSGDLGLDSSTEGAKRRKDFAEWLTQKDNPLTSRVMVNRIWHHIFGSGIVPTTSDFGVAGVEPDNPELLDWLASEFIDPTVSETTPWSMKAMIRLLVTTDAFRRSSLPDKDNLAIDAGSNFLWRFPPRRVSAEVIRDGILQASGKLNPEIGGRSYRIHNVKKTYAQWEVIDNHGEDTWRRMIYQERMRRVDDQIFTAFDFPDCGQVRAKRPISTTPLQALNLMNSDFVVEQSNYIAKLASQEPDTTAAVKKVYSLLLLREPGEDELQLTKQIADTNGLGVVCRSLINSNEFAFLP
ncbi:MAG: DUF1553 domain-containing protein [Verrucomicrobiales bacterium]|nr:DUF1553 domain-containing protein [Verrucomicrobiales bacterium]